VTRLGRSAFPVLLAAAAAGAVAAAQTAPPTPAPTAAATPKSGSKGAKASKAAPLDFSGVWEIDAAASKGLTKNMSEAVLSIRQNGDKIWMEPVDRSKRYISSDVIVVDGKLYEKAVGRGMKGTVQAQWGKDKASLWIQSTTGTEEKPNSAMQRAVWRLRDHGKVWTRQTWTVEDGKTRESFLVFRKQESPKP